MSKDAYYFPHDSNAKDDPKCVLMIEQLGMEGYGIYWVLIETLRDQPDYTYPVQLLPALARRYNTTLEKVKTVVFNYELFVVEEDRFFFSKSLVNRMIPLEKRKEIARVAGLRSAEKRALKSGGCNDYSTHVQHTFNEGSTIREEEIREDKIIIEDKKIETSLFKTEKKLSDSPKPTLPKKEKFDYTNIPQNFVPVIEQWLEYKYERKEAYKQSGFTAMCKKLIEYSGGDSAKAKEIIEDAMAKNYSGFFELKPKSNGQQNNNGAIQRLTVPTDTSGYKSTI